MFSQNHARNKIILWAQKNALRTGLPTDQVLTGLTNFLIPRPVAGFALNRLHKLNDYLTCKKMYFVNDLSLYFIHVYLITNAITLFVVIW